MTSLRKRWGRFARRNAKRPQRRRARRNGCFRRLRHDQLRFYKSVSWTRIHHSSLSTTCLFLPTLFSADFCINHMNRHFNELKVPEGQGLVLADITASPILFFHEANRFLDYLFYGLLRSFRPHPLCP